ncbi:MAG: conjugal transfer protein TrbL family protein [Bacillota bacterium]
MGNWMIEEGSKVSKEKIESMLDPGNFAALPFQWAALLILLAVLAIAFIAFLFSIAIFHADIMILYLLSPLVCLSVVADDNEYLDVWWRELLSQIVTMLVKIFLFVAALSILINENITFFNFLLLIGCFTF